ncbi:MAG: hypothetical protein QOD48_1614, partial [Gaiellaceae bacterium]|nr:hypothetical protein [Gaiellaceae bacterium]
NRLHGRLRLDRRLWLPAHDGRTVHPCAYDGRPHDDRDRRLRLCRRARTGHGRGWSRVGIRPRRAQRRARIGGLACGVRDGCARCRAHEDEHEGGSSRGGKKPQQRRATDTHVGPPPRCNQTLGRYAVQRLFPPSSRPGPGPSNEKGAPGAAAPPGALVPPGQSINRAPIRRILATVGAVEPLIPPSTASCCRSRSGSRCGPGRSCSRRRSASRSSALPRSGG